MAAHVQIQIGADGHKRCNCHTRCPLLDRHDCAIHTKRQGRIVPHAGARPRRWRSGCIADHPPINPTCIPPAHPPQRGGASGSAKTVAPSVLASDAAAIASPVARAGRDGAMAMSAARPPEGAHTAAGGEGIPVSAARPSEGAHTVAEGEGIPVSQLLPRPVAITVFLALAFAYFLSALVRAVTATLAPTLAPEFALQARDLGLLAGGYFLGFAAMQLPLGRWLDRHGPRKVLLGFLGLAVLGCLVFAAATGFSGLLAGRVLCGAGVSACLMAPLTGYRRWFAPQAQMSANSWMLMMGSLGMVASTLPVQWALPLWGWRPLFWTLAALIALAMV